MLLWKVFSPKPDVLRCCLQVQQVLTSSTIDSRRSGPTAESQRPHPEQERLLEELEQQPLNRESQAQSMPLVEPSAWRPDPLLEKPEGASPPHSEPGRQSFGDRDGAESGRPCAPPATALRQPPPAISTCRSAPCQSAATGMTGSQC